jgi:cytochrome c5
MATAPGKKVSVIAEELAHLEPELDTKACTGQVCHDASISAMAAFGQTKTQWTVDFASCGNDMHHQQIINGLDGGNG